MSRLVLVVLLMAACNGNDDTDPDSMDICGDPDGDGGDTGDVPNLISSWTGSFGQVFTDNNCPPDTVSIAQLDYLEQPFEVDGSVPSAIRLTFADNSAYRLRGTASPNGSWAMSGPIEAGGRTLYTSVSGMVYTDATGRVRWNGALFVGADINGDTLIDCEIRSDWNAFRSGS